MAPARSDRPRRLGDAVAFAPRLASGLRLKRSHCPGLDAEGRLLHILTRNKDAVIALAFVLDGRLATSSSDRLVLVSPAPMQISKIQHRDVSRHRR